MKVSETVLSKGEGGYMSAEFDRWGKDNATEWCCGVRRIRGREALAGRLQVQLRDGHGVPGLA